MQRRARAFFVTPIPTEDTNQREQQNEVKVVFLPQRTEHDPQPIMINERNEGVDDNDDSFVTAAEDLMDEDDSSLPDEDILNDLEDEEPDGIMQQYLKQVFDHLQEETKQDPNIVTLIDKWLLRLLHKNEWRIPASTAMFVCRKLGIDYTEHWYYWEIVVWLPDICWNEAPPCPNCERCCSFHAWRTEHFGRIVTTLYGRYYIIAHRYICCHCEAEVKHVKQAARFAAQVSGASIDKVNKKLERASSTFMGYNTKSRELLLLLIGNKGRWNCHKDGSHIFIECLTVN